MRNVTTISEADAFQKATADAVADPNNSMSILTMITLALEGVNPTVKRWAAMWLASHCNVLIPSDIKGQGDAATTEAKDVRR